MAEVRGRLGTENAQIRSYRLAFEKDLRGKWRPVRRAELRGAIAESEIVLVGDFHVHRQSQKTFLRLLRSFASSQGKRSIGLECLSSDDDHLVRKYLQLELSEEKFLKAVDWANSWTFPWENYRPIFEWARENKVEIFGLNTPRGRRSSLRSRDRWAARCLVERIRAKQNEKIFVLFGDLHICQSHLPRELRQMQRNIRITRILQNPDQIYFDLLEKGLEHQHDLVCLASGAYCILNVPPWVRWSSYLTFLESQTDRDLWSSSNEDSLAIDYGDHVLRLAQLIASDLGVHVDFSRLSVYSADEEVFWDEIERSVGPSDR
ncbi:MAG: ChaN family lipoprotein, partial [Bdellovibrionaceae bacterium]|nr:ChaN family lipoprotein [Pseudobdellovibrionaceae bacterium]